MDRMTGKELAQAMCDMVNSTSTQAQIEFADEMMRQHRTLQQASFGVMLTCIATWAKEGERGYFDMRNEATVSTCQEIVKAFPKVFFARVVDQNEVGEKARRNVACLPFI